MGAHSLLSLYVKSAMSTLQHEQDVYKIRCTHGKKIGHLDSALRCADTTSDKYPPCIRLPSETLDSPCTLLPFSALQRSVSPLCKQMRVPEMTDYAMPVSVGLISFILLIYGGIFGEPIVISFSVFSFLSIGVM